MYRTENGRLHSQNPPQRERERGGGRFGWGRSYIEGIEERRDWCRRGDFGGG